MRYLRALVLLALLLGLAVPGPARATDEVYPDCKGVNLVTADVLEYTANDSNVFAIYWTACYGAERDWVGIFPAGVGAGINDHVGYAFTNGTAHGNVTVLLPSTTYSGLYEVRYYADRVGSTPVFVTRSAAFLVHGATTTPSGTVSHVWSSLVRGSYQTFNWTVTSPSGLDRVAVYVYGGALAGTCYTHGQTSGQVLCPIGTGWAAGTYVACLYSGLTDVQLACGSTFTVT